MRLPFQCLLPGAVLLLGACTEIPEPATVPDPELAFVGSSACATCHEPQYSDWLGSHHELAMQVADESTVLGDFDDVSINYFDTTSHFLRRNGDYIVRTQNARGELQDFIITHTFGVTPLQQYLVEFDNGHLQPLPFAWDTRSEADGGQRWYHLYPDEYIDADDPLHWTGREQNWNFMCAECHSTDVQLNYQVADDSYATTWSEISVGCEACHGPASVHASRAQAGTMKLGHGLLVDLDDQGNTVWQMNLQTGIAERSQMAMRPPQQPESCGRCHARRGVISAEYEYGEPLAQTHRPALLREPLYFSDGQIRDEVYVYGSFLQSRMYQAGVSCSDCHNPHSLELRTGPDPDLVCAQCHLPERFSSTAHHGHTAAAVECIDCHMPARVYMGVDARHDHSLRIPRPDLSPVTGAPNACTTCHDDKSNAWAATAALAWWGEPATTVNDSPPGIVRATALANPALSLQADDAVLVEQALQDGDPLVRMAALQAAVGLPPESQLQLAVPLLDDPVRSVRIEAASLLAPLSDYLPASAAAPFAAAATEFRAAQHAVASRPQAHAALAEFEASLGNIETALAHSQQAFEMAPDAAIVRHSRGLLLVRAGRAEEALPELREAARLDPDSSRYTYVYAVALNSLGQGAEATSVLADALARFPGDFDIAWALATMQRDNGETQRALETARQLAERYPNDENVAALLASLGEG